MSRLISYDNQEIYIQVVNFFYDIFFFGEVGAGITKSNNIHGTLRVSHLTMDQTFRSAICMIVHHFWMTHSLRGIREYTQPYKTHRDFILRIIVLWHQLGDHVKYPFRWDLRAAINAPSMKNDGKYIPQLRIPIRATYMRYHTILMWHVPYHVR